MVVLLRKKEDRELKRTMGGCEEWSKTKINEKHIKSLAEKKKSTLNFSRIGKVEKEFSYFPFRLDLHR